MKIHPTANDEVGYHRTFPVAVNSCCLQTENRTHISCAGVRVV